MSAKSRFDACLAETLKWEGGWSNHPHDTGGATMRGVIQRVYDAWRERKGLPKQTVRKITDAELQAIYRENYWQMVKGDELPAGVDLAVFDYGVNSGPSRSIKYLQQVLGIAQDGHMGAVTLAAVNAADPVETVKKLCAARRKFVRQIKSYPTFGRGWNRRIDGIEQVCCRMCSVPVRGEAIRPLEDIDAQSAGQGRATEVNPPMPESAKAAIYTGGTTVAAAGVSSFVAPPPPAVSETVSNVGMWQSLGSTIVEFVTFAFSNPPMLGVIVVVVAGIWLAPKAASYFKRPA